ncbi:MAG: hypothetical protein AMXMBFR59_42560 [Rhodanobacteraceae bacterium]
MSRNACAVSPGIFEVTRAYCTYERMDIDELYRGERYRLVPGSAVLRKLFFP